MFKQATLKPLTLKVLLAALLSFAITLTAGAGAKPAIPDARLLDQEGREVRFYRDLLKGRVVAINFIYTTCAAICPRQGQSFRELQARLGERLGKDVLLISITSDPETDTPERLKAWAARFGAKPGWTLVTGEKSEVDRLVKALTGDIARTGEHSPFVLIGSGDKQVWRRANALAPADRLSEMIESIQ
jgi:protein SCO1